MAIVRAVKSGVWSDTTVWNTGALPTADDDVYSNTFTVTIDTSPTVLSIRNGSTTGVTAGGSFVPTDGITLTCTGAGVVAGGVIGQCFDSLLTTNQSCNVVSVITGGTVNNSFGLRNNGLGTVNITGAVAPGTVGSAPNGVSLQSAGTINITGNVSGNVNAGIGAINSSTGVINIVGTVTGGTSSGSYGASNQSSGVLQITGTCQAGTGAAVAGAQAATTILSGPFLTNNVGNNPVIAARWFWANSNVTPTYYQIRTANLATIRPLYTADSVGGNPATSNVRSGTVYGPDGELTGTCAVPPAGAVALGVPVDNTTGTAAIDGPSIRSALGMVNADLDSQLAALPTAAEIRTEVDTNSAKLANLDATVSSRLADTDYTAPLDAAGTRGALGLASADLDTQITGINSNVLSRPTADDVADSVWDYTSRTLSTVGDIVSGVWDAATRTITGGTVDTLTNAPDVPTETEISTAVRSELSTELSRIDATISSRLAPDGILARVTLTDTATTLTNAPVVPTPEEIATEVWATVDKTGYSLTETERTAVADAVQAAILDESDGQAILQAIVDAISNSNVDEIALVAAIRADLERIDGILATRLAAIDYTEPPTAEANAAAVRDELNEELSRIVNTATTQEVADIVEGSLSQN